MKTVYKRKLKRAGLSAVILCLTLSMLLLSGCGTDKPAPTEQPLAETVELTPSPEAEAVPEATPVVEADKPADNSEPESVLPPQEESEPNGTEYAPVEEQGSEIVTPYITLYCPEDWGGDIVVRQYEESGEYRISFKTDIGGVTAELFTLIISPNEMAEGFPFGLLKDANGVYYVFAAMNEQGPDATWNQSEYALFCSMQERVNDFIMQFHEDARFSSGR